MFIIRNILALLLAFQVINPMCACVAATSEGTCCDSTPSAPPACCSSEDEVEEKEQAPDKEHLCMCPSDPQKTQDTKTDIPSVPITELPELITIELPELLHDTHQLPVSDKTEHHPPGRPIRVLYSIFLL